MESGHRPPRLHQPGNPIHKSSSTPSNSEPFQTDFSERYKLEKEAFVSDLTGGSVWKINAVSLTAITTYTLWSVIRSRNLRFGSRASRVPSILSHPSISHLSDVHLEFILLILPLLLANTLLAHHVLLLNLFIISAIVVIMRRYPSTSSLEKAKAERRQGSGGTTSSSAIGTTEGNGRKKHKKHWSNKFSSDEEGDGETEDGCEESWENQKLKQHSRGESYTHSRIPSILNDVTPFRVSVDSSADAARASAAPPTSYVPPGSSEADTSQSYYEDSSSTVNSARFYGSGSGNKHYSRDSTNSELSGYSNGYPERTGSVSDILRSTLPPLSMPNDEEGGDRSRSGVFNSSSSSYGSPIEAPGSVGRGGSGNAFSPSSSSQEHGGIRRMASPLGRVRASASNLSSAYQSSGSDGSESFTAERRASDTTQHAQSQPQRSNHQPYQHQQYSTSSSSSSSYSNMNGSPSRPPSAPPGSSPSRVFSPSSRFMSNNFGPTNSAPNSPFHSSTQALPPSPPSLPSGSNHNPKQYTQPQSDHPSSSKIFQNTFTPNSTSSNHSSPQFDTQVLSSNQPTTGSLAKPKAPYQFIQIQPFLTVYRSHMMLMTVICILAVDFQIFPREFAKCETWGTSLMDLGVGSFVFSLGLVSALPFLRSPRHRFRPMRAQLLKDLKKSAPLLLIGGIRVIMVKGVEYPEHVTEYGVHWNFFITLGILPIAGTLCRPIAKVARFSVVGLIIGSTYQALLWFTDLQEWVISNGLRHGIIEQNKEGISSMAGYLSLFLIGLDLGHYVLPRDPYLAYRKPSKSRKRAKTDKLVMVLASFSILWWAAFGIMSLLGAEVSRRVANLSYVLWVTAFNTSFILCYVTVYWLLLQPLEKKTMGAKAEGNEENLAGEKRGLESERNQQGLIESQGSSIESLTPKILNALNSHAFVVFLVANLLTGVVNLSMRTLYTGSLLSILVLLAYTGVSLGVAIVMEQKGWSIRF